MNNLSVLNKTIELATGLFDTRKSTVSFISHKSGKPEADTKAVKQSFDRVSPESQGVPSTLIRDFISELHEDGSLDMHGITVLRNGKIIAEAVFGLQDRALWKMTFSAAKTVTALAVGLLVDKGQLSLSDKVAKFFDKKLAPLSKITVKDLTVEDLLTMRSCIMFNEASSMVETDWQKGFLNAIVAGKMGEDFNYNSLNSYMLASIVTAVTQTSLSDFLKNTLFKEMGIEHFYWETCPCGIEKGGWGLYMHPEDMAKLGQLVLNKGLWKGKRLISQSWIDAMTTLKVLTPESCGNYNYGYHIWVGRYSNTFLFNGMFGQNLLGFFDNGILILSNAGNEEVFQSSTYYAIAEKYFGQSFPSSLPESPEGEKALRSVKEAIAPYSPQKQERGLFGFFKKKNRTLPDECNVIDGVTLRPEEPQPALGIMPITLQATQNNYTKGISSVDLRKNGEENLSVTFTEGDRKHRFDIVFGSTVTSDLYFNGEPYRVNTYGKFGTDEDGNLVLTLLIAFTETPFTRKIKIRFLADSGYHKAMMEFFEQPGEAYLIDLAKTGLRSLEEVPVINSIAAKADMDYIRYKVNRVMEPRIKMVRVSKIES